MLRIPATFVNIVGKTFTGPKPCSVYFSDLIHGQQRNFGSGGRRSRKLTGTVDEAAEVAAARDLLQQNSLQNLSNTSSFPGDAFSHSEPSIGYDTSLIKQATGQREIYRCDSNTHEKTFQWGIGSRYRALNSSNRSRPAHILKPKQITVPNDYYSTTEKNIKWEDLNEQWEVYWYEYGKLNARPFPVKKFGLRLAKEEAHAFSARLQNEGRLQTNPTSYESGIDGVHWDAKTTCWVAMTRKNGYPAAKSFSADIHGLEKALELATEIRKRSLEKV